MATIAFHTKQQMKIQAAVKSGLDFQIMDHSTNTHTHKKKKTNNKLDPKINGYVALALAESGLQTKNPVKSCSVVRN